jgi:Tol biopolymer transport system component
MKRMGMRRIGILAVVTIWAVVALAGNALGAPGDITLASTADSGAKGDAASQFPSVSADGTKVAFVSAATNLDPADADGFQDIYVRDLITGNITLASTTAGGDKGNGHSFRPSLSADGATVAFYSEATNLDPADIDTRPDVYVKDLVTGDVTLASTSDAGVKGNGGSGDPSLSADGAKVAFESDATNLDPADTDTRPDIYVKDLVTGDVTLASTSDPPGVNKGNGHSIDPSLSAGGTEVAFASLATNLDPADTDTFLDIYVKDLATGDITLASTSDASVKGNGSSGGFPSLSAGGTEVAFESLATNLDPADTDTRRDIYVKDLVTGDITLASTSDASVKGNGLSDSTSLTADGAKVAFNSNATNLDPADTDTFFDVYVKDLVTGDITLASTSDAGVKGNRGSGDPSLSADGAKVAFHSFATNLDPADTDGLLDVYVKEPGDAPVPATVTLSPPDAVNPVGTSHTVTGTVKDLFGNPVSGVTVRFTVTGSVNAAGSCVTDPIGQCAFTYDGPALPGADAISAYADSDGDGVQGAGEPIGEATKSWLLPSSTPGQASGGGNIADSAGNKIAFGFSAKNENNGLQGQCNLVDPSANAMVKCEDVTALIMAGNEATIYGNATHDGTATTYVIRAKDVADPGRGVDTFSIQTASGYSRSGTLTAGNVQVG